MSQGPAGSADDGIRERHVSADPGASAPELFSLRGRTAVVTGGTARIGRVIARGLAEAGAHVILTSRSYEAGTALADTLEERGLSAEAMTLDQGEVASIDKFVASVEKRTENLDVLVNAAVARPGGVPEAMGADAWDTSLAVNGRGLALLTTSLAPLLERSGDGSIINVASTTATLAPDFRLYESPDRYSPVDYTFVKGGMLAMTRYLAAYLAPRRIRVNCLSPGGFYSNQSDTAFLERYCARVPLGRMAVASDIVGAIVFLASPASRYVTGQNLVLDGGLGIW